MKNSFNTGIGVLLLLFSVACTTGAQKDRAKRSQRPNIILIMADDLGYNDIGSYGNERINTPNIDFISANGLIFSDYHSNGPVCSPTRAALMTGRYQQRAGIEAVVTAKSHRHTGLSTDQFTLADFFKEQNYVTGLIGKWHLGYDTAFSPKNNGFDYFKGFVSGNVDYHSHVDQEGYFDWWENKSTLEEKGYTTDLFTRAAIQFISENQDKSFFLYLAHEAPHYPYQGRKDPAVRKPGRDFKIPGPKVDIERAYKEMIEVMDEGIGALVECLISEGILSKTMIFFCSDNGASTNGSNYPLKGFKASLWEGGHRVPAIAFWDGHIQTSLTDETVLSMDIFPTLIDLVDPGADSKYDFDGRSFMPVVYGEDSKPILSDRPLFWRFKDKKSVRLNEWKMLIIKDKQYLFNLDEDLSEQNNLVGQYPELEDQLLQLLHDWESDISKYEMRAE